VAGATTTGGKNECSAEGEKEKEKEYGRNYFRGGITITQRESELLILLAIWEFIQRLSYIM